MDLRERPQVVYPLGGGCLRNEQTVLGCEITMAKRDDAIAAKRAAPQGTALRPALRVCKQPLDEALGHPGVMNEKAADLRRPMYRRPRIAPMREPHSQNRR